MIQEHELPLVYQMEHEKLVISDEIVEGDKRQRGEVVYDDGLSEEQWLEVNPPALS